MSKDRLVEIETRLAFQEKEIQELNSVVFQQQKQIDQLEELCKYLQARFKESSEGGGVASLEDEKPPHY